MKENNKVKIGLILSICTVFIFGFMLMGERAKADSNVLVVVSGEAAGAQTMFPVQTPAAAAESPNPVKVTINANKVVLMAKKKYTLSVKGAISPVTWTSRNPAVATVTENGVVKGLKKGIADITAQAEGTMLKCTVTVVPKMNKKDFGKFTSENFVGYCERKRYDQGEGYAWVGQWEGGSKKKTTYRGIKIGMKKSKVKNAYGQLNVKKCTSKDPFTAMKGLKSNKVKTYVDMKYGKYRIRYYFNKKNKVVAIIFTCNFSQIKSSALSKYM